MGKYALGSQPSPQQSCYGPPNWRSRGTGGRSDPANYPAPAVGAVTRVWLLLRRCHESVQFAGDASIGAPGLPHAGDLAVDPLRMGIPALIGALLRDAANHRFTWSSMARHH